MKAGRLLSGREPVLLYSELDEARLELRKVELFRDGRAGFASAEVSSGGTQLGERPIPTVAEISADPQFEPAEISQEEFERVWSKHALAI